MNPTSKKSSRKLQFKAAGKFRGNIVGSFKFSKMVTRTSKPKWSSFKQKLGLYGLIEVLKTPSERPLERISRSFGIAWNTKQAYKQYYTVKNETQWTRFKELGLKKTKKDTQPQSPDDCNYNKQSLNFLILWESRLDTNLWTSNLAPTLKAARQYINHGFVSVNYHSTTQGSRVLNSGDLIQLILPKKLEINRKSLVRQNFTNDHSEHYRHFAPFHLEVHYESGTIIFTGIPKPRHLYHSYPLRLPKLL